MAPGAVWRSPCAAAICGVQEPYPVGATYRAHRLWGLPRRIQYFCYQMYSWWRILHRRSKSIGFIFGVCRSAKCNPRSSGTGLRCWGRRNRGCWCGCRLCGCPLTITLGAVFGGKGAHFGIRHKAITIRIGLVEGCRQTREQLYFRAAELAVSVEVQHLEFALGLQFARAHRRCGFCGRVCLRWMGRCGRGCLCQCCTGCEQGHRRQDRFLQPQGRPGCANAQSVLLQSLNGHGGT